MSAAFDPPSARFPLHSHTGHPRDWVWRGWQTRYAFVRSPYPERAPLVFVHGFGVSGQHWRRNLPVLGRDRDAYTLDLVGFGGSEKPPTRYHIDLWASQAIAFWQTVVQRPAIWVGNSIGALVATIAVDRQPEMARGVVAIALPDLAALEAMVPPPVRPFKRFVEGAVSYVAAKPLFYWLRRPATLRAVLRNVIYRDRTYVDDELIDLIARPARERRAPEAFLRLSLSLNQPGYSPSLTAALQRLQVPLLILWGTQDAAIPPAEGPRLVAFAPHAQLVMLEGLGHCPHDEAPDRVNHEIATWIAATIDRDRRERVH